MIRLLNRTLLAALLASAALAASAAEFKVSTAADITKALGAVKPGDEVVMTDGAWDNQTIVFRAKGMAEKPITLRAQTPGKTILTGTSTVRVEGEYIVASGLLIQNGTATSDGITLNGTHNRLTESAMTGGTHKYLVHLRGYENRVDHCYLDGKTSEGPTLQVAVEGLPNHHQIDHNHFGPRRPLGRNGGETMRIGYSTSSMTNSSTLVEHNLFDRCDGELEIISSKSCDNIYRYNTFLDCAGMLTLRHGNRCLIEGNFFFGHHKRSTGGIRVIGEDHTVINNYIEGVEKGVLWITAGVPNSALAEYFQAKRCLIAFNTIVDCKGPVIELDAGFGSSKRSLRPENITIANNLFSMRKGDDLLKGTEGEGFKWIGNAVAGPAGSVPSKRFITFEGALAKDADGLFRPAAPFPAEGDFPNIKKDIDGQSRTGKLQAGCDQSSTEPITVRPMTVQTAGPSWMERTAGEQQATK